MALIKCTECGGEMSSKASKCPKCGKTRLTVLAKICGLIIALFIVSIIVKFLL